MRLEHNLPERRISLNIAYALVRHVQLREERKQHLNAANRVECAVDGMRDDRLDVLFEMKPKRDENQCYDSRDILNARALPHQRL